MHSGRQTKHFNDKLELAPNHGWKSMTINTTIDSRTEAKKHFSAIARPLSEQKRASWDSGFLSNCNSFSNFEKMNTISNI
eukprot:scaffold6431_cov139-Skeletonema_menzelii.AAC.5